MNTSSWKRAVELLLNALSLVAIVYLAFVATGNFSPSDKVTTASTGTPNPLVGRSVAKLLPLEQWGDSPRTIVLFTRSACSYCQKNARFHRQVAQLGAMTGVRVIAVSDDPLPIHKASLQAHQLNVTAAYSASLGTLGIVGTPSIAVVDRFGLIRQVWQGFVTPKREAIVLEALGLHIEDLVVSKEAQTQAAELEVPVVPLEEIGEYIGLDGKMIIDVRSREAFALAHIQGAVNIPQDELEIRASREIAPSANVAVFCEYISDCENGFRQKGVFTDCTMATMILRVSGLNARLLPIQIATTESAGLRLVRSN